MCQKEKAEKNKNLVLTVMLNTLIKVAKMPLIKNKIASQPILN